MLDITAEMEALRSHYSTDLSQSTLNALVIGPKGSGKTRLLSTCRKPVLLHSFDPGGSKTLLPEIKRGEIIPITETENENPDDPTAWSLFEERFEKYRMGGIFEQFGTYAIDSATFWLDAMENYIIKSKRRTQGLEIQDYKVIKNTLLDIVKMCASLPCDFIMTGHIIADIDSVTGSKVTSLAVTKSLKAFMPTLFDEMYVMLVEETSKGQEYKMLTRNDGKYLASTRLGRDKFEALEEPNIKMLLQKAGLPYEDKPSV